MGRVEEVRFKLTVKFNPKQGNGGSREFFKPAVLPESLAGDNLCRAGRDLRLVKAVCTRKVDGGVKEITNWKQVQGSVVYCSKEETAENVEIVLKEVAKHGAIAAFVRVEPSITVPIPVFVFNEQEFNLVLEFGDKNTQVSVNRVQSHPLESSKEDDALAFASDSEEALMMNRAHGVQVSH